MFQGLCNKRRFKAWRSNSPGLVFLRSSISPAKILAAAALLGYDPGGRVLSEQSASQAGDERVMAGAFCAGHCLFWPFAGAPAGAAQFSEYSGSTLLPNERSKAGAYHRPPFLACLTRANADGIIDP